MLTSIKEAIGYLESIIEYKPSIGIILGTGLGALANEIEVQYEIPYADIPNFPTSTVSGHEGKLLFGILEGKNVVVMQGRFHYYEGYSMQEVILPVRVMKLLGVKKLIISNAAGGMNPAFKVGDLMLINDHINLFPESPLRGHNIDELGPRFPDMSEAYDKAMLNKAIEISKKQKVNVKQGVYIGLSGPCFETPAEYKYLRVIGGDAVGMSTVPEVIAAIHMGMKCLGVSVITDLGVEGVVEKVSHEEVKEAAAKAEPKLTAIVKELVGKL